MIELKNVSKYYYRNGVIATGFSKVNLKLDMGEFVVITGESGSGKSTLLNVISGLDTYEEGEMLIKGQETSHYVGSDFEEYRKKYIGNIFQEFNLVNSYTVYQNVELTLMLSGRKASEVREEVNAVIDKVGLSDFRNQKVARLSGGQKQRVAIARALAKDTPVIVADEPTGSLDSQAAAEVIRLLREVSKEKLVIIVTHNIEQVEQYATRLIKMHDGSILEDVRVCEAGTETAEAPKTPSNIKLGSKIRLGTRNAFNILPKFVLIFVVFLLISLALLGEYSSYLVSKNDNANGSNDYFFNTSPKRIVLNKENGRSFTEDELAALDKIEGVSYVVREDALLDASVEIDSDMYYISGVVKDIDDLDYKLTGGTMPEKDNEFVVAVADEGYMFTKSEWESTASAEFYLLNSLTYEKDDKYDNMKLTGYVVDPSITEDFPDTEYVIYAGSGLQKRALSYYYMSCSDITYSIGNYDSSQDEGGDFTVVFSEKVPKGQVYATEGMNYAYKSGKVMGRDLKAKVRTLYYTDSTELEVTKLISSKKEHKEIFGNTDEYYGVEATVYINPEDIEKLYSNKVYQCSVFLTDVSLKNSVLTALEKKGYKTISMDDSTFDTMEAFNEIFQMLKLGLIILLIVVLFFISYFVLKLIMRSRKAYFTTLRTLGGRTVDIRNILSIELLTIASIGFGVSLGLIALASSSIVDIDALDNMVKYLSSWNYIVLYIVIAGMSYLLSVRYARSIFKSSVIGTLNEEV